MQHVGERFRVHQTMLDRDVKHLHQLRMAFFRALESMLDGLIKFFTQALVVALDFRARRPIFGRVRWKAAADGVDPERKKVVESSMEGTQPESPLRQEVPVEGFDVAYVENDAVALGDGPVIEGLFADQLEKLIGTRASL